MGSATNANAMAASTTSSDQQMEVDAITNAHGFLKGNPNQWRLQEAPVTTAAAATTAAAQAPHKDAQLVFTVDATDLTSMAKGSPILIPNGHGHEDLFNMTETVQTCMCKNRRRRQITCLKCVTFGRPGIRFIQCPAKQTDAKNTHLCNVASAMSRCCEFPSDGVLTCTQYTEICKRPLRSMPLLWP